MRTGQTFARAVFLLGLFSLAACAGGRGGNLAASMPGGATPPTTTAPPPPPAPTSPPPPVFWDTALTGAVGVPAPASFGESPVPAQIAPPDGSNFETANNSAFPVLATSLQATSTGLSAVSSNQSATAIVTSTGKDTYRDPCTGQTLGGIGADIQLSIPSLNLNLSWSTPDINNPDVLRFADSLTYVLLGNWAAAAGRHPAAPTLCKARAGMFSVTKHPATVDADRRAGDFHRFGPWCRVHANCWNDWRKQTVDGPAAFSADFASGKITGAFTQTEGLS